MTIQLWMCWVLQVFGGDAACAGYLGTLISVLFGQTISMLTSIQVFIVCYSMLHYIWVLLIRHSCRAVQAHNTFLVYYTNVFHMIYCVWTCDGMWSFQEFTSQPDVADDCFLLASRCIRYCPHLLIPTTMLPPLVDCAMTGITIQHRFSSLFLKYCTDNRVII